MIFYRYDSGPNVWPGVQELELKKFKLIKRTPCGHWIVPEGEHDDINSTFKKWVNNYSVKRYAYSDRKLALKSFVARKKRQITILTSQIATAKDSLNVALKMDGTEKVSDYGIISIG